MKKQYIKINNLSVASELLDFVNNELLKDTKISPEKVINYPSEIAIRANWDLILDWAIEE